MDTEDKIRLQSIETILKRMERKNNDYNVERNQWFEEIESDLSLSNAYIDYEYSDVYSKSHSFIILSLIFGFLVGYFLVKSFFDGYKI